MPFVRPTLCTAACTVLVCAASRAQTPPSVPFVNHGLCPFECCTYREWSADSSIRVFTQVRDTSAVAFVIPAGRRFQALTGDVYVTTLGRVLARRPLPPPRPYDLPDSVPMWNPGDTLYLVGYIGEGAYRVWWRGHVIELDSGYWREGYPNPDPNADAVLVTPMVSDWWVRVAFGDRRGWIRMDEAKVGGADACGL